MAHVCPHLTPILDIVGKDSTLTPYHAHDCTGVLLDRAANLPDVPRGFLEWQDRETGLRGVWCLQCKSVMVWPDPERDSYEPPTLCSHLEPFYQCIIRSGNEVKRTDISDWSKIDLLTKFRVPVSLDRLTEEVPIPPEVRVYKNESNSHYEYEEGLICEKDRQAIAWPLDGQPKRVR